MAPNSIIDTAAAQTLHVKAISSGIIQGTGKGDISANDAGEVQFTVAGFTSVAHAKVVDLSTVPVPVKADRLLSAEFLDEYVLRIDPAAHTIAFLTPTHSPIGAKESRCLWSSPTAVFMFTSA